MGEAPEEVRRLAEERAGRRAARDFETADELRDRIRALGYEAVDGPGGGYELRPLPGATETPQHEFSVHWLAEEWPQDVARGIAAFDRHHPGASIGHVIAETVAAPAGTWPPGADVVSVGPDQGWAAARNAALSRATGRVVVVIDGSVEPEGDVLSPLGEALRDPTVGVAGPFGVVTDDLRDFRESSGPEVDAIEGYLMAFRREVVEAAGGFDRTFRFYRAADIELSFRIRDTGLRAVVVDVPARRHEHRAWTNTPPADRERLSRRNFYRFLDRFRDRFDLCVSRRR
ncbi:MAG: glycosyltransferase [Actinomycetota bacterium]